MKLDSKREYKLNECIWLGELPDDWDFKRLKYVSKVKPSNVDKKSEEDELPVLLCNYNEVYKNDFIDSSLNFMEATASPDEIEKFQIEKGDVIITKDSETPGEIALPAYVLENLNNTLCGYHLSLIRSDKVKVIGSYLFRLFQSKQFNAQFTVAANGITRFGLDTYSIKNAVVSLPTVSEQHSIAQFLDYKTEQIDKLIEKKEKLLKLLEEKRIALITNAVTGHCHSEDPDSSGDEESPTPSFPQMKDSGVAWLGDIPQHWSFAKTMYLGKIITGGTPSKNNPDYWEDGEINWLNSGEINKKIIYEVTFKITSLGMDNSNARTIPQQSILIALNGQGKTKGSVALLEVESTCSQSLAAFVPNKKIYYKYLYYFLESKYKDIRGLVGEARDGLNLDHIKSFIVPSPPLEEQKTIVEFIERELAKINRLSEQVNKAIEKLKEYRTSLITSAVTGKIDLRNWQPTNSKSLSPQHELVEEEVK